MLLLACISLAVGTAVGAEEEFLTVPTETFRAQAARADDSEGFVEREPLASQLVFQLPPPTMTERNVAGDPGGASDEEGPRSPVPRVGFGRDIAKQAGTSLNIAELSWVATQDGGLAAALGVVSPEAQALRVRLAIKGAPRGLEVRVYDGAGTAETVVSVPRHQLPAAEGGSAELWTPTVPGDAVTVELYLPPGTEPGGLTVSIPRLSHFDAHPQARSAGGCTHTDVACRADEVSDATRRSVAKYLVTDSSGDTGVCTGQLLNDADAETQIPYFLTARHCVENQEQASSMEFHWFYERDTCGGPAPGAATRQTGGARVLAFAGLSHPDTGVDHLLVRLISDPPSGAALAGWTTAGTAPGDTAVGVSHPAGLLKTLVRQSIGGFTGFDQNGSSHILTTPDVNLEGGSSGSGLWKRIDGGDYLVGVLTGVSDDACHGAKNYYGRFDRFYPKVSRWLGVPASVADSEYYPLSRLTLVDAATRAEVADLTAGDAVVDLAATAVRSFDIVAEITWKTHRVALTLTGPRPAAHASGVRPYTLFGPGGGSGLVAGDYRVSVVAHKAGATDTPALETEVPFEVTGDAGDDLAVAGLALVVGTAPRIIELADGANVTVYEGEAVAVRARTSGGGDVGSVGFALSGAGTHEATANDAPFAAPVSLAAGTYRIAATPYAAADGGGDAGTALAVTGVTVTVAPGPVTGFTLVDAAGGLPDADMGAIIEGDTIDLTQSDGWASVRADLAASAAVTSVDLALDGPRKVVRTVSGGGVVSLFGEAGGDYAAGEFPEGAYTLTATPYAGPAPRDVLPEARVAFTVTGGFEGVVAGFTLIEAGGAPPDPDFAAITDGATLSLRGMANKRVSIRAELAYPQAARSVRFKLRGPVAVTRTDNEAPYLLFGETGDDIHGGMLPDGTYTLTAQPFPAHSGSGEMPPRTVTFTIADSGWQQTRVSGFTLIDAQDGPPDPAVGPIGQDATIYWPRDAGEHSIRADLSNLDGIGSVRLRLSGPDMNVSRDEDNDGSPFTVFGDDHRNGDIRGRRLPLGHYYIEATPFSGQDGAGSEGVPQTASFTLAAPDLSVAPLTGFSLVDAGVTPEAVVGTIESDATVNLATLTSGAADIRAGIAAERPDVGSVVFELRGPRGVTRTASSRPFSLFGGGGSALPNGVYTLTATAHDARDGSGDALGNASVTFTVSGGYEAGTAPVTGFTLVDARHGLPDPDLGPLADGTKVDLSGTGGLANVRAELALRRADVGGVVLTLKGPRPADRIASARVPVSLFGDSGGDYVVGTFPAGDYTLTARPAVSAQTHGFDAGATGWTVRGGEWRATGGIIEAIEEADLGSREGKALLDGFEAADLVLEADVRVAPGGSAGVVFRARDVLDLPNRFRGYYAGVDVTESQAVVGRMDDGVWHQLATQDMDAEGPWYRLKVAATGPRIEVFVDSAPVLDVEDATYASGAVGLRTGGLNAAWDDVAVARLDDPDGLLPETAVTFTVTSAVPEIGIAADGAATEGGTATYRVTATPAPIEEIVVNVSVTQGAGDNYLPAAPPDSVAIAADATQATLSVALPDDGNDELDGILTATLTDGTGYAVSETAPSANLAVRDDDVPVVAIASRGLIVTEGGTAVFELWAEPVPAAKLEVSVSVTQGPNDDYLPDTLPTSVTFAARARDATLSVALPDDAVDERKGILTATLMDGTDYAVSKTFPKASFLMRDNDVPVVSIAAGEAATEGGAAVFTINAAPAPAVGLEVPVSVTQGPDDDFLPDTVPTTVAIAAGATQATLSVALPDDAVDEPDGVLTATVAGGTGYAVSDTAASTSLAVRDDDVPMVSIAAGEAATEGSTAAFAISVAPAPATELEVSVSVTQGPDDDFLPDTVPTTVAIVAGATQATLSVALPDDGNDEPDGVLTATLADGPSYAVSEAAASASLAVHDDDVPVVAIGSRGLVVIEGETAVFELWAEPVPATELEVSVSVTQGPDDDYLPEILPTSVTFAARARDATLSVALPDDAVDERKGILTATLMDGTGYAVSKTFPDAAFIARDNDVPVVSIAAGEAATEGGTAEFAITAAPVPAADLEVSVSVTQGPDDDFLPDAPPTSVTIAAAATEATLSVELPDDSADEPDGVVTATILAHPDSYEVATASASLTVHDNDQPPLTAAFHDVPAEHWGKGFEFGFLLEFSEDLARELSSATLRDHALAATNATVTRAARVVKGENRRWMITVVPESGADVTVTLAATTDCSTAGALCTEDGRPLSGSVSATVAAAPPLKAEFVDMPKSHDGTGVFEFELRFSEDFPGRLPYTLLRDEAFRVERGAVRKAGRVDQDQNQRWTIAVRPDSHEDVTVELPAVTDCDAPGAVCTEAGRPLSNTVTATVEGPPPLTAEFVGMPESHDGVGLFEFELRFSEDFPGRLPYTLLRDHAFEVTHGTVQGARRVEQEQNRRWVIEVQPDSHEDVTVKLPAATDCDAQGAVCTEAGRPLSATVTATVEGPPPLTAEFVGMPESHDGVGTFEFELRFSEDFPGRLPPRLLRDEAFEVTHGTVQRARRVEQEQNRRWTIAVQPDSHEDVTVELPAATDCDAVGAVCTEAGRPLSNTTTATVAGPQASAQVDGSVLTLAWETRRDGFALPSGKDFAVRVDGGLRAVASTSLWMRGVVLGLAEPVRPHQAVAVDYLGSAMHPLRDGAGDAEPAWRDLPAVNVTGVASAEGPAVRATAANRPPVTDDVSASFAGLELGDTGLAVAGIGTDVRRLDLSRNGLADIATLARLRALESLDLSDNDIIDVSALRGLTALRRLDLGGNDIVEVWPLADLPDLEVLVLDGNRVADVGALTHMARLENLGLARNAVEDISPLADLRSLRRLDLGWNPVRDLSPVGDLQRLVWLRLPDAGGDAPTHRLVLLRWLLAPDTPGTCLGCAVLRND